MDHPADRPGASRPDRRTFLKGAAVTAAAAGGLQAFPSRRAAASPPVVVNGTTLDSTVVRGSAVNAQGYVRLTSGPGEPHVVRDDLGTRPVPGRHGRRTPLLSFVHLTDIHVMDAQSPARVEFLDRYNDGPGSSLLFSSAYRPQEMLMPQFSDAMVAAIEQVRVGPVTGRRFDFALCTGDNTDNAQRNETRWGIDVLDGTPLTPASGDPQRYEGVADQDPLSYDVHYWHPDGTPAGQGDDNYRRLHGYPVVPGLLEASQSPFTPIGLSIPWFTAYGNHDGLVQGNFPRSFQLNELAVGPLKPVALPAGVSPDDVENRDGTAFQDALTTAPARVVTADPERSVMSRREWVEEHFTTGGRPLGHGLTSENVAQETAYYVFEPAPGIRGIVLDSVNPNGNASGSLDPEQFAWLRARLEEVSGPGRDRLVVVFSHHTVETMNNPIVFVDDPQPRVLGPQVRDLLLRFPNVVAWVNGHTHRNTITPFPRPDGGGGFWQVNTAAHIDFPCQSRLLEVVDNRDGTLSIFGTLLDAAAPLSYGGQLGGTTALASLARELSANDPQDGRSDASRGAVEDRNVELLVKAPFARARTAPPTRVQQEPPPPVSGEPLPATGGGSLAAAAGAAALAAMSLRARRRSAEPPAS
jgi:metallophosphoesterase (TIGR03767 family)